MALDEQERRQAARILADAEARRAPVQPLTETFPEIDVASAYQIQLLQIEEKLARGEVVRGHKVGLSSRAMQQLIGVDEPDYGHLLASMFVHEGHAVKASELCAPLAEMEIAFVLGRRLSGPHATIADVLAATAYVCPALEIVDSRVADWKIKISDTIADNASSARVVLGGHRVSLDKLDLRTLGAVLRKNGEIVETGAGAAVLGHPATSVAWLANKVFEFGVVLEEGHVILPGALTRAVRVAAGDVVRADFDVLGHVSVSFI